MIPKKIKEHDEKIYASGSACIKQVVILVK
jgi:hypothetical protein